MNEREYVLLRRSIVDVEFVLAGTHGYVDPDAKGVLRAVADELRQLQKSLEAPGLAAFRQMLRPLASGDQRVRVGRGEGEA